MNINGNGIFIAILLLLLLPVRDVGTGAEQKGPNYSDPDISFCRIIKDKANIEMYHVNRSISTEGLFTFKYWRTSDSFKFFFDTSGKYGSNLYDSIEVDKIHWYPINGKVFKVVKLIADKDVTDGSCTLFFSNELGLLLTKSNTWRAVQVMIPDEKSPYFTEATVLLHKIQSDADFFENTIPHEDMKRFKTPEIK